VHKYRENSSGAINVRRAPPTSVLFASRNLSLVWALINANVRY
jgi:hypothetical protein